MKDRTSILNTNQVTDKGDWMKNLYLGQKRTVFATVLALFVAMLTIALPGGVTIAEAQNTNPFGCAPGEIFLSSQEWWTNPGGVDRGEDGRLGRRLWPYSY
jgi:hypothetical protein